MAELIELACPNCGAKLDRVGDADRAVCPHCGSELLIERKAAFLTPDAGPLRCPHCGEVDRVQKVSATYASGVSTGSVAGWTVDSDADVGIVAASGHSQTQLSRLLAPPTQPRSTSWAPILLMLWLLVVAIPGALVAIMGLGGLLLVASAGIEVLVSATAEMREAAGPLLLVAVLSPLGVAVGVVAWVIPLWAFSKEWRSHRQRVPAEKARWERAVYRWDQLYYCARDDGAFILCETSLVPINQLEHFLYRD